MHAGKNFNERNLRNFKICGNELHKKLILSKEIVADKI